MERLPITNHYNLIGFTFTYRLVEYGFLSSLNQQQVLEYILYLLFYSNCKKGKTGSMQMSPIHNHNPKVLVVQAISET